MKRRPRSADPLVPSGRLARAESDAGPGVVVRIRVKPPYDSQAVFGFLRARAIPGVEVVNGESYARTVAIGPDRGVVVVHYDSRATRFAVHIEPRLAQHALHVVERVGRIFDVHADTARIEADLRRDARMAPIVATRPGLRVPGTWDPFELAVRAILGQQVSVAAATTLAGRLARRYGESVAGGSVDGLTQLFPTPTVLASGDLESCGLIRARADAIRSLAAAVRDGRELFAVGRDLDRCIRELCELRGFGVWTASYVAMRAIGEPDAFPRGDLVLRKACSGAERRITAGELERVAEAWRPWRAYAAMHLWTAQTPAR